MHENRTFAIEQIDKNMSLRIPLFAMLTMLMASCQSNECRIHGEMPDNKRDGKQIFLVPTDKTLKDSIGVDSTTIVDGKFEFVTEMTYMAVIRVDYHVRYGLEDLLVITEPGDINVKIGERSSAQGTNQNDILQEWKEHTQAFNEAAVPIRKKIVSAQKQKDSVMVDACKAKLDSMLTEYKDYTTSLTDDLDDGLLKEFFSLRAPTRKK